MEPSNQPQGKPANLKFILITASIALFAAVASGATIYYLTSKKSNDKQQVVDTEKKDKKETAEKNTDQKDKPADKPADLNRGYLVIKEWGVRFKIPAGLADIRYYIHGDTAYFYAKPSGQNLEFRADHDKPEGDYALATLTRSTDSTKERIGGQVEGRKTGEYYYYTAWSFSGTASGVGLSKLYFDNECDQKAATFQESEVPKCQAFYDAANKAFGLLNGSSTLPIEQSLLGTIEAAK